METRIKTIKYKNNNSVSIVLGVIGIYFLIVFCELFFFGLIKEVKLGLLIKRYVTYAFLINFAPVFFAFMFAMEMKKKEWITIERFVEGKDGKVWRRLKGVKVE